MLALDLDGEMFTPDSAGYDAIRRPVNPAYRDVRPRLVVLCRSVSDVVSALSYAAAAGERLAPRGGGHCFAGRSSMDGILLDLSTLDRVSVADDGVATIGAGARLQQVYAALHAHGRTLPAGCGPTVGVASLTFGGGIGLFGRKHGLTCDRLVGARVVLADATVVDCVHDRHPDLFWALRGRGRRPVRCGHVTAVRHRPGAADHPHRGALVGRRARGPCRRLAGMGTGRPRRTHRQPHPRIRARRTGPGHLVWRLHPRRRTDPGAAIAEIYRPGVRVACLPAVPQPETDLRRAGPAGSARTRREDAVGVLLP